MSACFRFGKHRNEIKKLHPKDEAFQERQAGLGIASVMLFFLMVLRLGMLLRLVGVKTGMVLFVFMMFGMLMPLLSALVSSRT